MNKLVPAFIALVIAVMAFTVYFQCTHHCVKSHEEWKSGQLMKDINNIYQWVPGHYETECDEYAPNE